MKIENSKISEYIMKLPLELQRTIYYFIPLSYIRSNETKLIKNVINVYNIDHHHDLTKQERLYYVKNIISFSNYVFWSKESQGGYDDFEFGRKEYDTLELSNIIEDKLCEM